MGADQCVLCGFVPADMAQLQAAVKALQEGGGAKAAPADPEANAGGGGGGGSATAVKSWHKMVDGNGLALMVFCFGTFMFCAFLGNIDGCGVKDGVPEMNFGIHFLVDMLEWGVCVGLFFAGLAQGLQGDHLGFTSYMIHAAVLGSMGYQFEDLLQGQAFTGAPYLVGWLAYACAIFDFVFTIMAFRAATIFGILYFFVMLMFLLVGLNFTQKLDGSIDDPTDTMGNTIAGAVCGVVAGLCALILIPVMTGIGAPQIFGLPNPIGRMLGPPPGGDAPAEDGVIEPQTKIKLVDANGLALMVFAFGTWLFFGVLCNMEGMNWGDMEDPKVMGTRAGLGHLVGMLIWGVSFGLIVAGVFHFANGDHLGFTSYLVHATVLGTTGWWLDDLLHGFGGNTYIWSYYYYATAWFDFIFCIMGFRIAKMFGVLYFCVALMFLVVGLQWSQKMDDSMTDADDHTGSYIAGIVCLVVSLQAFYLTLPVMTGKGLIL